MTRLSQSVDHVTALLTREDLATDAAVRELLELATQRRGLDRSDLSPPEQTPLSADRLQEPQPSPDALAQRLARTQAEARPCAPEPRPDPPRSPSSVPGPPCPGPGPPASGRLWPRRRGSAART